METRYRQLVLCPADKDWTAASPASLITTLRRLGILGPTITPAHPERFLIGEAFLQLFSFMGCAPSIEFEPVDAQHIDWSAFVFIQLSPSLAAPRWWVDAQNARPACPQCRRRNLAWQQQAVADAMTLTCPHCQQTAHVCHWRWFDAGACARQFVSIVNVYPKESMPTDAVLSQLQAETAVAWQYFYVHAPLCID